MATIRIRNEKTRRVYDTTVERGGNTSYNYPEFWDYYQNLRNRRLKMLLTANASAYLQTSNNTLRLRAQHNLHVWMDRNGFVQKNTDGHGLELICKEILGTNSVAI